ncbi:MAG: hypothetical protein FJW34_15510 [Acidobacteria bacterium]|nr:hypothetical protein [Acidobacteriota bacterium]
MIPGPLDTTRRLAQAGCLFAVVLCAQAPQVNSITPASVPIAGGAEVSVRGSNFTSARVTLDGVAVSTSSTAADEIRFAAPKHDNGYAILRVSTPAGTAISRVLYIPPPLKDLPPGYITTIAGVGRYYGDYGPAREASVEGGKIAYGPDGSLLLPQAHQNRLVRIRPDGILEPIAGKGVTPMVGRPVGDGGPALEAHIGFPRGIAVDSNGDAYTADTVTSRIWRVEAATGIARVIAGTGERGFSGDGGVAIQAKLNLPSQVIGDGRGTLWFIDSGNARIRRITPDGRIDTICGTGIHGFSGDGGGALSAQINFPYGPDDGALAYDPDGFLYISDEPNHRIRRIDLNTGIIDTFIGPNRNFGANLLRIRSVMVGPGGDLYFQASSEILHVTRGGQLRERFGATDGKPTTFDGTPLSELGVGAVWGLALDAQGNLVWSDNSSGRVLRMNRAKGVVETVAGIGPAAYGEDGPAVAASPIEHPNVYPDLAVLPTGEVLFSGLRLRKIGLDGRLSVIAGAGPLREGPAINTQWQSLGFDLDAQGNLYYATYEHVVQVDAQGILRGFAGLPPQTDACGFSGDGGPARAAELCQPHDLSADRTGNVFIADSNNNRIRRVDATTGIITTIAGSGPVNGFENFGQGSYCGDGGPATLACLNTPVSVGVSSQGDIFVKDVRGIRKVDRDGIISTFFRGSMAGTAYMALDAADNLYVAVSNGIARVTPGGSMQLLAGQPGTPGFGGDGGPAAEAARCDPAGGGVAIDGDGNLFFVDGENRRIRAVRYGAVLAPRNSRAQIGGGTPQTAPIGMPYADPLAVVVLNADGTPAGHVRVDFSAPRSGPACVFANQQASVAVLTDRHGRAQAGCTANTSLGGFGVTAAPLGINAMVSFSLANVAPRLASNSVVNGASFLEGPIAPAEIVSVFGAGLGPAQLAQALPGGDGRYGTQLAGVRVRFNGTEAPVLFARFDQVGAIVPHGLDDAAAARVSVEYAGVASNTITVPVARSSPAVFSMDSTGRGQGAILNQDSSVNSAANPADRGSIVVLFGTGAGQTDPPGVDGRLALGVLPKPRLPVSVAIGGQAADILYAGAAPTLVAGFLQINARVPAGITPGTAVPVKVTIGDASSPAGITLAVR